MSSIITQGLGVSSDEAPSQLLAVCSVLVIVSDYRDYLQIQSGLGQSRLLTTCWSSGVAQALASRQRADVVLWQPSGEDPDTDSALGVLSSQFSAPVVVLSASAKESVARQYLLKGAADYLCRLEIGRTSVYRCLTRCWHRYRAGKRRPETQQVDPLTRLPLRPLLTERVRDALQKASQTGVPVALAVLNLSGFRRVNQNFGFEAGDKVVCEIARRLQEAIRPEDTLARVGSDEFAVLITDKGAAEALEDTGNELSSVFKMPLWLAGQSIEMLAAIGLARFPDGADDPETLLSNAHLAMNEARRRMISGVKIYEPDMRRELKSSMTMDSEFRHALRTNELAVYYQPKLDAQTGLVTGVEALVRWPHPKRGMIMPGDFVPAAERTGMIIPMGYWILERTCQDLALLQSLGFDDLLCSVNLSFRQFHDRKLSETVFRIIYNSEVDTTNFEFELTESAMMFDMEYTRRCLTELAHLGIRFALDDFGTGYSSFSTLRNLPISTVKIDKSFVDHVTEVPQDAALVTGMISLAHQMGLTVVAEGVETGEQMSYLRDHHCDQLQGYYIAKPLPLNELCDFLARRKAEAGVPGSGAA